MTNFIQPIINLTNANLQATSRFIHAQEITDLTQSGMDKYSELVRESWTEITQSEALNVWMRQTMQNFSRFSNDFTQSMFGLVTQAPNLFANQMKDFSQQVDKGIGAAVRAAEYVDEEMEDTNQARTKSKQHRQATG